MDDLQGTAQDKRAQLDAATDADAAWLRRQLERALAQLDASETAVDIDDERRQDF